uniref:DWNN domain-containing protein n=1 Tax=Oryzias latipes TaxID=8090 RepID=A0A3P9ILT2_ORYLA
MAHIHYKFSSKLSYDTVVFDGPHITLTDLKRRIMGREKLRAGDCDLQITNAQTKEEYTQDEELISKGSSVIVRRIPINGVKSSSSSKTQNTLPCLCVTRVIFSRFPFSCSLSLSVLPAAYELSRDLRGSGNSHVTFVSL